LVDDEEMAALNGRYRSEREATDVLAFPQQEGTDRSDALMGDVVISVETALRQSRTGRSGSGSPSGAVPRMVEAGNPLGDEILRLLIHGTLHLLGFDHGTEAQRRRMRKEEGRCFQELSVDENSARIAKEAY
jgi:ssRNA-specific RNase YbeY (16S rRNA maturation enzyme)